MKINPANLLTLIRIAAIPVVVICFYSNIPNARPIAGLVFGAAAITYFIDGYVARNYDLSSRFGEFLDPVADKLMVAVVLVLLVQSDPQWYVDMIAIIIIGREITVSALREWMATIGERAREAVHFLWGQPPNRQQSESFHLGADDRLGEHDLAGNDVRKPRPIRESL